MRSRRVSAAIALTGALLLAGLPAEATTSGASARHRLGHSRCDGRPVPPRPRRPPLRPAKSTATLSVTSSASGSGAVTLVATSNAKSIQVTYRDCQPTRRRSATEKVRKGQAQVTLPPGSSAIRVRAKATSKLTASPWVEVSPAPDPTPSPGATYWVSKSSKILGKLARYKSVNKHTRDYYLIRSYMQKFEAAGGGTLVLGPGRYVISSTIYVPSNTTIRLSEGTTLVKGTKTGTKKFSASNSMFMLIEPSRGKKKGAVGGHNGASGITIAGAGEGRSVIDLANVHNSLAIIAGHNRDVTISGITFQRMNNNHFIEMDACADCAITGNEFLDAARGTRDTAEAINLDTPDPRTHGFGSVWSNQDGTPNERVTISSNRFDGMERALGTHNFTARAYHTDIVVTGNTITEQLRRRHPHHELGQPGLHREHDQLQRRLGGHPRLRDHEPDHQRQHVRRVRGCCRVPQLPRGERQDRSQRGDATRTSTRFGPTSWVRTSARTPWASRAGQPWRSTTPRRHRPGSPPSRSSSRWWPAIGR